MHGDVSHKFANFFFYLARLFSILNLPYNR